MSQYAPWLRPAASMLPGPKPVRLASLPIEPLSRGDEVEVATAALKLLRTSDLAYAEGKFWRYEPKSGVWGALDPAYVRNTIAKLAGTDVRRGYDVRPLKLSANQINGAMQVMADTLAAAPGARKFNDATPGIAFTNGFLDTADGVPVLLKHSPDNLARRSFPFAYDAGLPHPLLDTFLSDLFADAPSADARARTALVQEFIGACITGRAPAMQRCLVVCGDGGNGKSALLEVLQAACMPGTTAALPPQKWGERFQIAHLVGVLANVVNEIPSHAITSGDTFKSVVTGEAITAECKNKAPFTFRPEAGHIFSANKLPGSSDNTEAYWRRFVVCLLSRDMLKVKTHRPNAAVEVIDAELPAIVSWAIQGAVRLQRQGQYTVPASSKLAMTAWRSNDHGVKVFLEARCTPSKTKGTRPVVLYKSYSLWAKRHGLGEITSTKFVNMMAQLDAHPVSMNGGDRYPWAIVPAKRQGGRGKRVRRPQSKPQTE